MLTIFLLATLVFILAYRFYGSFLDKKFNIDGLKQTPSHTQGDGVDCVPCKTEVLFGHHFSSIAGAGPIVGPIIAGIAFGWLPALLWIVLGSIFIGGMHDYASLVASIRHKARSIAEITKKYMSTLSYKLFLIFIWLALVYILIVFVDLTAESYIVSPAVASSSGLFIVVALLLGIILRRSILSLRAASFVFVPVVFMCVYFGQVIPMDLSSISVLGMESRQLWIAILLLYCFFASTSPVWVLLQPRDYLSSFLLYGSLVGAFIGLLIGGFEITYPAFTVWSDIDKGTLFPILFITVACGACSGFHSIVASGTTSKQLNKETDARKVGYGAMLLEGLVAVIALFTVVMVAKGSSILSENPLSVYGNGIGQFLSAFGLPFTIGQNFGILAVSTFLLTTLDTASRLGRYILQELIPSDFEGSNYLAAIITLILPLIAGFVSIKDSAGVLIPAWKAVWPIFGVTNQLLASFALLVAYVWMRQNGKKYIFLLLPMLFMMTMTVWALVQIIYQNGVSILGGIGVFLLTLTIVLILSAIQSISHASIPSIETQST